MVKAPLKAPLKAKAGTDRKADTAPDQRSEATYIARADGWVAGRRVKAGDTVLLTKEAARYEPVDLLPQTSAGVAEPARLSKSATELGAS